jgi:hypothetical protein
MDLEIVNLFRDILYLDEPVRLYNTYIGVLFSYKTSIQKICRKSIILKMDKYQVLCIRVCGKAFNQGKHLPEIVKSQAIDVRFIEILVNLTEFEYWGDTLGNRIKPRVVPIKDLPVMVSNGVVANSRIVDLSAAGLALVLSTDMFDNKAFRMGRTVQVDFRDPGKRSQVRKFKGTVTDVNVQAKERRHRVGIHTIPEEQDRLAIVAYVSGRQAEIPAEAEPLYPVLVKKK